MRSGPGGFNINRDTKPTFFYGYVVTAAASGIWLIGWGAYTTFGVFFKPLITEFGWTRAETALAYSLSLLVQGTLGIFMGWLTDRLGPRKVVLVFSPFVGLAYLLMSQLSASWQLQLYFGLVAAIGFSAITVPPMVAVTRWFIKKQGLMIGIAQAGSGIGGLVFAPLAGWLILANGWRFAFIMLGIVTLAGLMLSGAFLRRDPREVGQLPDGATDPLPLETDSQSLSLPAARFSLRQAAATAQFWMIAGIYFSFGFLRDTIMLHIAAHVQDLGFSLADGANVLAVITGASIFGRIVIGRMADVMGNRPACIASYMMTTLILAWALVTHSLWGLYLFALVFGFGWGAMAVLRFAVTVEAFGPLSLGLVIGVLMVAEASAAAFSSYIAGYLFDAVGNYSPAFWISIAVSAMGTVFAWKNRMRR